MIILNRTNERQSFLAKSSEKHLEEEASKLTKYFDVDSLFDVKGGYAHVTVKEKMREFAEVLTIGCLREYGPWSRHKKISKLSNSTRSFFMFGRNGCLRSHIEHCLEVEAVVDQYQIDRAEYDYQRRHRFYNLLYPGMFTSCYDNNPHLHKYIYEYLKHSSYKKFKNTRKYGREAMLRKAREYYKEYLLTEMWKELKKQCLEKSNFRCEFCGMKAMTAHHVVYPRNFSDDAIDNLVSVCDRCHGLTHGIRTQ